MPALDSLENYPQSVREFLTKLRRASIGAFCAAVLCFAAYVLQAGGPPPMLGLVSAVFLMGSLIYCGFFVTTFALREHYLSQSISTVSQTRRLLAASFIVDATVLTVLWVVGIPIYALVPHEFLAVVLKLAVAFLALSLYLGSPRGYRHHVGSLYARLSASGKMSD